MPQRFLILLTQVQAGNASENLLSEIQQTVRSLYQAKKNIQQFTQISIEMSTMFMNSKNSKTFYQHSLMLKLADKIDF